jgi:N6-L-threonylcarbamoyladenine synthase
MIKKNDRKFNNTDKPPTILAIETSCDETSIAITRGRTVLSLEINSQIDIHSPFGGVVPEVASRHHLENINRLVDASLKNAGLSLMDIDVIAATKGPGLIGALVIGIATAKGLAFSAGKPLVGVHHIYGHIAAAYIEHKDLEPPFLAFIASGGHTTIAHIKTYKDIEVLGATRDDAIGEAYDKVARVLGLGYPGGPKLDGIAKQGDREAIKFKRVLLEEDGFDFSFSGLKTQVINTLQTLKNKGQIIKPEDVAASFQEAVMDVVKNKLGLALKKTGMRKLAVVGGVASNSRLREIAKEISREQGVGVYVPSPIYCTDNAAMIGVAAYEGIMSEFSDDGRVLDIGKVNTQLGLDAYARFEL